MAISTDGNYIVSGSRDNKVKLWDVNKKSLVHTFKGHRDWVNSVATSNDGNYIVSGSKDRKVKLWDVNKKSLVHTFEGHQDSVNSVAISNDGNYIVSGSKDDKVKLWAGAQYLLVGQCERIKQHPVLVSPEIDAAFGAANACIAHGNWSKSEKAELLVKQGLAMVTEALGYQKARTKFKLALKHKPDIDLNPYTEEIDNDPKSTAYQLAAKTKVKEGIKLAKNNKVKDAIDLFKEAQKLKPDIDLNPDTKEIDNDPKSIASQLSANRHSNNRIGG